MKKGLISLCVLLCALLSACGGVPSPAPSANLAEPSPGPAGQQEPPQMSMLSEENAPARAAYAAAPKNLLDNRILPDGSDESEGYVGSVEERQSMAVNQFAVYDVDGDGREELILLYTTAAMAGMTGFVYDWEAETGELREQLIAFPDFTFYRSGAVKAGWSHNQGKGGGFWPFSLYRYDVDGDAYVQAGSVDAWDRALAPEGYPEDVDKSGTGFVYYIYEDLASEWDKIAPVDAADYQAWLEPYLGEAEEIPIPYAALTAEHINMLVTPG